MDPGNLLGDVASLLAAMAGTLLLIVYKSQQSKICEQERRIDTVEQSVHDRAEKQRELIGKEVHDSRTENRKLFDDMRSETNHKREEARADLSNFRNEINSRIETVRTETNSSLNSTNSKIDGLVTQVGALTVAFATQAQMREQHRRGD